MKRTFTFSILFLFAVAFIFVNCIPASKSAASAENEEEKKEKIINDVIDSVDLNAYEELLTVLTEEYGINTRSTVKETILKIIKGEPAPDPAYFFYYIHAKITLN